MIISSLLFMGGPLLDMSRGGSCGDHNTTVVVGFGCGGGKITDKDCFLGANYMLPSKAIICTLLLYRLFVCLEEKSKLNKFNCGYRSIPYRS